MTRKDYEKIAREIRNYYTETRSLFPDYAESKKHKIEAIEDMAQILADIFQGDNELFDSNRFLGACIPNEDE